MKSNKLYNLALITMITVVIYSLSDMVSFSITLNSTEKTSDLISLLMTSISAISTVVAVTIAYLAYRQWHKPNTYLELLKTRKNLLNKLREIGRSGYIANDTIRLRIIDALGNFQPVFNNTSASPLSDEEKRILLDEIIQYKTTTLEIDSLITESLKERTILFYKSPKELEQKIDSFLRHEQGRTNIISHCIDLIQKLFSDNIEEEERAVILDMLRMRLKHVNNLLSHTENIATIEDIRTDIEKELRRFTSG